jgi:hypothetical protein
MGKENMEVRFHSRMLRGRSRRGLMRGKKFLEHQRVEDLGTCNKISRCQHKI